MKAFDAIPARLFRQRHAQIEKGNIGFASKTTKWPGADPFSGIGQEPNMLA